MKLNYFIFFLVISACAISCNNGAKSDSASQDKEDWQVLFNGENLDGWIPKIGGYEAGVNGLNTFRVKDGIIDVNYDEYDTFVNQYGHLFYKEPFSSYYLEVEYRFKGEQTAGGQGWAFRNSGIMFHAQDPNTMTLDQSFPICVEYQFLGGNGTDERSTGNLCTPNSHVTIDGKLVTDHCINSISPTYHGDQWVKAGLIVYKDSVIYHVIQGDTVMTYSKPIIDSTGMDKNAPFINGQAMTSGYFALQAESHPMEFRNIRIKNLSKNKE